MRFKVIADTDVGTIKKTNQDSLLVKQASCEIGEVLLAVVCDGMGGLAKGELASATVIKSFAEWFDQEFPNEIDRLDMRIIGEKWTHKLKELNVVIAEYAQMQGVTMGTTFSGILFAGEQYLIVHVGDTRVYHLGDALKQITSDQTFIAREIKKGVLTAEQAKTDKRRNMLLQCVGASDRLEPEVIVGQYEQGAYLLCSDGFRHEISEAEIFDLLQPKKLTMKEIMAKNVRCLIDQVKKRGEKDNISAILIKVD